jgi:tetratricopeptide (TPR) repeat protein
MTVAHDLRAALLSESGRFDEALAACRPAVWGSCPPAELAGRAAWVKAAQGRLAEAATEIAEVLRDNPGYHWARQRLADWQNQLCRTDEYLRVARDMVCAAPWDAMSHGYLGHALQSSGNRKGAEAEFALAAEIDASYEFAWLAHFDIQLDDQRFADAERTFSELSRHLRGNEVSLREARLAVRRGSLDAAMACVKKLTEGRSPTTGPCDGTSPLLRIVENVLERGWHRPLEAVLLAALDVSHARAEVAIALVKSYASRNAWWKCRRMLNRLTERNELWLDASAAFFLEVASSANFAQRYSRLRSYLRRHAARLRADVRTWGAVGHALTESGRQRAAIRWMADWRERKDVTPGMLLQIAIALHRQHRSDQASVVHTCALELPSDHTTRLHALWLAAAEIIAGATATAGRRLESIGIQLDPFYDCLYGLLSAAAAAQRADLHSQPCAVAIQRIRGALDRHPEIARSSLMRRIYHRCAWRIATDRRRSLLAAWHRLRSWQY